MVREGVVLREERRQAIICIGAGRGPAGQDQRRDRRAPQFGKRSLAERVCGCHVRVFLLDNR